MAYIYAHETRQDIVRIMRLREELRSRGVLKSEPIVAPPLFEFFQQAWEVLEPGKKLKPNWHHEVICEYLTDIHKGGIKRLLINVPPRTLKSTLVSMVFPCWEWIEQPTYRYIFTSHSQPLLNLQSISRRELFRSDYFQNNFGRAFTFSNDNNQKVEFQNNWRGLMQTASFGGQVTGRGGERTIVDDPHDAQKAFTENQKESDATFFRRLISRLNDVEDDSIIVVMQRVGQGDVSDIALELGYEHLLLPARATATTARVFLPSGELFLEREINSTLDESRLSESVLGQIEEAYGRIAFGTQYQQTPSPEVGGMFEEEWFSYAESYPDGMEWVRFWDCAVSKRDSADYTASIAMAFDPLTHYFYLKDLVHERMQTLEVQAKIIHWIQREKDTIHLVEVDGIGEPIFQNIATSVITLDRYLLAAPKQHIDKVMRARQWQGRAQARRFKLYDPERKWSQKFFDEVTAFRSDMGHAHDDIVDTISGGYDWLAHRFAHELNKSLEQIIKEYEESQEER